MFIPTYLKNYATNSKTKEEIITCFDLVASNGKNQFIIEYYGELFSDEKIIVSTEFAPQLVVATEPSSGEKIVLFDGTKHGYNAMFCDEYSDDQKQNRPLVKYSEALYSVKFEVIYNIDYEEEKEDFISENGDFELMNGETIDFETLQNNGFDFLSITLTDSNGKEIEIIHEELA